ncbi:MAG: hypothetical protein ACO3C1_01365 [Ilumatobacteraceae bacterium]
MTVAAHRPGRARVRIAVALTTCAVAALPACSSDERSLVAVTTSSTSTLPDTTVATSSTSTTAPHSQPTVPPSTSAPVALYRVVDPPTVDGSQTDEFAADGPLADGSYWALYNGSDGATPFVTLYVAYFGDACVDAALEYGDECLNDVFVRPDPTRDLIDVPFADDVRITLADVRTGDSYLVDGAELVLASTGTPDASAPDGFQYTSFAFIMTVADGEIVAFEQFWTP